MLPDTLVHTTDTLALVIGLPVIAYLLWTAIRRARQVRERIRQVQDEMARSPLPPLAQLGQILDEREQQGQSAPQENPWQKTSLTASSRCSHLLSAL